MRRRARAFSGPVPSVESGACDGPPTHVIKTRLLASCRHSLQWHLPLPLHFGPAPAAVKLSFQWIAKLRNISALDHSWRGLMWAEFRNRAFLCGPVGSGGMLGTDALGLLPQFLPDNRNFGMIRCVGRCGRLHAGGCGRKVAVAKWPETANPLSG